MPSRFTSGAYEPELVKLMGQAFDSAWDGVVPRSRDESFAKKLLASAIIAGVEAGEREPDTLVQKAADALTAATTPSVANKPLSFGVDAAFRREFKNYALSHGLKLNELLRLSFESYRKEQGD